MSAANDNDVVITRVFNAPRALVFAAWTDPSQLQRWWGPRGYRGRCELDARPGGKLRIVMISADGVEYPMTGVFSEVKAPERLVYTHDLSAHPAAWHDKIDPQRDKRKPPPSYAATVTVTFDALGDTTRVIVHTRFESSKVARAFIDNGMSEGWGQSLDRLSEQLPTPS